MDNNLIPMRGFDFFLVPFILGFSPSSNVVCPVSGSWKSHSSLMGESRLLRVSVHGFVLHENYHLYYLHSWSISDNNLRKCVSGLSNDCERRYPTNRDPERLETSLISHTSTYHDSYQILNYREQIILCGYIKLKKNQFKKKKKKTSKTYKQNIIRVIKDKMVLLFKKDIILFPFISNENQKVKK